jgi:hypothetical protein
MNIEFRYSVDVKSQYNLLLMTISLLSYFLLPSGVGDAVNMNVKKDQQMHIYFVYFKFIH